MVQSRGISLGLQDVGDIWMWEGRCMVGTAGMCGEGRCMVGILQACVGKVGVWWVLQACVGKVYRCMVGNWPCRYNMQV